VKRCATAGRGVPPPLATREEEIIKWSFYQTCGVAEKKKRGARRIR